jgi:UDP-N-acetylmuramoyl-tripeptide--D-alanyl-D-alanine ligase
MKQHNPERNGFGYGLATMQDPSWTLAQVLAATGGSLVAVQGKGAPPQDANFRSISTDSRTIGPGDIFLALSGDTFDGLTFAAQAVGRGAAAIIGARPIEPLLPVPMILVADTLRALGDLAHFRRTLMARLTVVAITGSSGKTTVKEMTAEILGLRGKALKTAGNFNNLIGLPLSLLPVNYHHQFAVLEMGMNCLGEIARLAEIADPDVACINNIQAAHLAGLGNIEGVARAKGELFVGCRSTATLAVNHEDPLVRQMARRLTNPQVSFGFRRGVDVRGTRITSAKGSPGPEGMAFTLEVAGQQARVRVRALGRHNVSNALAAGAMAYAAGADRAEIVAGIEAFTPKDNRFGIRGLACGLRVINDSYNANPSSMRAALATVAMIRKGQRTVAVLGDMLELGPTSSEIHAELGAQVPAQGFDYLLSCGEHAKTVVTAAKQAGMTADAARAFTTKDELASFIKELLTTGLLQRGDLVLVKGSRGMRMEQVIAALEG